MRWLERHTWWMLQLTAGVIFLFGGGDLAAGAPDGTEALTRLSNAQLAAQDPAAWKVVESGIRAGGLQLMRIGTLLTLVLVFAFRRNLRWAWGTPWSLPIYAAAAAVLHLTEGAPDQPPSVPAHPGAFFTVLCVGALLASTPRFRANAS